MFDFLVQKFSSIFSRVQGNAILTEKNIDHTLDSVRDALLEADVPYSVVNDFTAVLKKEVVGQKVITSLKPAEHLIKIVRDKLVTFLSDGQSTSSNSFNVRTPSIIMVMGLQGSGKTTTIAKLARYLRVQAQEPNKKMNILVASVDYYRPAAVEQLKILAEQVGVSFYQSDNHNPLEATKDIYRHYENEKFDILLLDTAGRLHVDTAMLNELQKIDAYLMPQYKILVLDAMTGQESITVAQAFDHVVGFTAAILTKIDSDTRGGAAFAFRYVLKKVILFVGTGEKVDDLSIFYPERVAARMLGMGDLQTLIEKTDEKVKQSEQDAVAQSLLRGKFTLQDFATQLTMMSKIGSLAQLTQYLPHMGGKMPSSDKLEQGEKELKKFKAIIDSMTVKERIFPALLNNARKIRIARGSGTTVQDIAFLLQRFEQAQQYVKLFKRSGFLKNMFR